MGTEFADAELYEAFVSSLLVQCRVPTRNPVDERYEYACARFLSTEWRSASPIATGGGATTQLRASGYSARDSRACACLCRHDRARRRLARWLLEHLERCNAAFLSHIARDSGAALASFLCSLLRVLSLLTRISDLWFQLKTLSLHHCSCLVSLFESAFVHWAIGDCRSISTTFTCTIRVLSDESQSNAIH